MRGRGQTSGPERHGLVPGPAARPRQRGVPGHVHARHAGRGAGGVPAAARLRLDGRQPGARHQPAGHSAELARPGPQAPAGRDLFRRSLASSDAFGGSKPGQINGDPKLGIMVRPGALDLAIDRSWQAFTLRPFLQHSLRIAQRPPPSRAVGASPAGHTRSPSKRLRRRCTHPATNNSATSATNGEGSCRLPSSSELR